MKVNRLRLIQWVFILCLVNPVFGQIKLKELHDFAEPAGNWLKAGEVQMDSSKPENIIFKQGGDCFVNGVDGSAKYLVSKQEFQDMEFHIEFMLPKGSNSGIYFQCRYELQLFDSWGATDLTFYDCGGIQNRWDKSRPAGEKGIDGYPPRINACKAPGEWQSLDILFRAPKFNSKGEKIKNASFEKVILNGVVVQQNAEMSAPTKGALFETEVASAPFRLQGGHGPVAFRNIRIRDLANLAVSKQNKWVDLFENAKSGPNYDFIVNGDATQEEANTMFEFDGKVLKAMYKWQETSAPYGIAVTKKAYSSYDLKFEFKWGERRFEPRLDKVRDAGLLYHCQVGTYAWPPSLEYQIQEGDCGDLWCILGAHCDVVKDGEISTIPRRDYTSSIKWTNEEKPGWNKVFIEVRGDKAKYYLNGVLVNEITNATYGGLTCTSGFIGLQAEYAELIYRKIKIKEIFQ